MITLEGIQSSSSTFVICASWRCQLLLRPSSPQPQRQPHWCIQSIDSWTAKPPEHCGCTISWSSIVDARSPGLLITCKSKRHKTIVRRYTYLQSMVLQCILEFQAIESVLNLRMSMSENSGVVENRVCKYVKQNFTISPSGQHHAIHRFALTGSSSGVTSSPERHSVVKGPLTFAFSVGIGLVPRRC